MAAPPWPLSVTNLFFFLVFWRGWIPYSPAPVREALLPFPVCDIFSSFHLQLHYCILFISKIYIHFCFGQISPTASLPSHVSGLRVSWPYRWATNAQRRMFRHSLWVGVPKASQNQKKNNPNPVGFCTLVQTTSTFPRNSRNSTVEQPTTGTCCSVTSPPFLGWVVLQTINKNDQKQSSDWQLFWGSSNTLIHLYPLFEPPKKCQNPVVTHATWDLLNEEVW